MVVDASGRGPVGVSPPVDRDRTYWREVVAPYERASIRSAVIGLVTSAGAYVALTIAMYFLLEVSVWLSLALAIPASGFLLRTFIVFHDCTHGSYLPTKRGNLWLGRITGLLVFQPFANWGHNHAVHHGTAGDLDRRGQGDVTTLTVEEYAARPWQGRLAYRLFRNPVVMFGIGPIWSLMIGPRLWTREMRRRQVHSVWLTDLVLFLLVGALVWVVGPVAWLLVQMPIWVLAGAAGVFLFYIQHQFEDAYWETGESWDYADAALKGSSYLKLPKVARYFSGNIGLHHVHHLSAKIPNYNLQRAHDENRIFADVPVLSFADGVRSLRLKLIDPAGGRLLTWGQARALAGASGSGGGIASPAVPERSRRRPCPAVGEIIVVQDRHPGRGPDEGEHAAHLPAGAQQDQHRPFPAAALGGPEDDGQPGTVDQGQRREIEDDPIRIVLRAVQGAFQVGPRRQVELAGEGEPDPAPVSSSTDPGEGARRRFRGGRHAPRAR